MLPSYTQDYESLTEHVHVSQPFLNDTTFPSYSSVQVGTARKTLVIQLGQQ